MSIELNNLVGLRDLTGVDFSTEVLDESSREWAQVINFVLDGKTYSASEDPTDGYRSCMRDIVVTDYRVCNLFPAVKVLGMMRETQYSDDAFILDLVDVENGRIVLSVGTDYSDSYYPQFVCNWRPENLHVNANSVSE